MKRKLLYITLIITILCVISIIICNRRIKKNASQKLYTEITETPKNNVGLLLGTSPKLKNGNNNLYFDYRIFATLELYKAGKINYILISGDNRKENYNEPEEMKKALMQRGVPEKYIYLDYAGFRTLDSVVRAKGHLPGHSDQHIQSRGRNNVNADHGEKVKPVAVGNEQRQ